MANNTTLRPQDDLESGRNGGYTLMNAVEERGLNEELEDLDNSADKLWSLYEEVAKRHDEAQIRGLKDDMDGIIVYAGLLSAAIAAFVAPKLQDLQVNPAEESVHYQQQSAQILAQISLQIASIGTQTPLNATSTPISPYPTPHPSASDRIVAVFWLISLVFSLSAALLSTLVQQWVRVYMRVYQRSGSPSKKTRIRQYLFEGVEPLPVVAEAPPCLIHLSLILFLLGLVISVWKVDKIVGVVTVVSESLCGSVYFYYAIAPIGNPQSPYRNPFSDLILLVIQNLRCGPYRYRSKSGRVWLARREARQEKVVMEPTKGKGLDVRAVQWLVNNMDKKIEMETFVLAIPSIFNQEWGRDLWTAFSNNLPPSPKGTVVDDICRYVQDVFGIYSNEGDPNNKKAQRKRMRGCIETVASLVCCTDVPLNQFGKVGEVLSDLGTTDGTTELSTSKSNTSFTVRWTCLSLVAIRQMVSGVVEGMTVRRRAGSAVDGIARFQSDYGDQDTVAFEGAQRIDQYLKAAWKHVEYLSRTFEPRDQNRTRDGIRNVPEGCELQISELERIANEANGMEFVDWRISLLQDVMDVVTDRLTRQLPGVSFSNLKSSGPISIAEAFNFPILGSTSITPQFIFPGQQIQALCTLGRGLRDIIEDRSQEKHEETIKNLESINKIPISSRRLKDLMIRQLWRMQDLRDGGGLGFTIELFFLAVRQLSYTSSSPRLKEVFYTGTFKVITSGWEEVTNSSGTQRILLNLICDLVIKSRGLFSDFSYPEYIVDMLFDLVQKMVNGHGNVHQHIRGVVDELRSSRNVHRNLWDKALLVLDPVPPPHV